jgi:3',5'-cyclic AMP phosphodiesterase CpdA
MPASPKTYTLRVLHLSDLHERVSLDWMSEDRKLKIRLGRAKRHRVLGPALEERLKAIAKERPPDLLVFTGDLADFGLDEEYVAAKAQLIGVLKLLGLGWDRVFLVPGNHDIKRKEEPTCWSEMRRFAEDHHNRGRLNDWLAGTSPPPGAPTNGLDLPAKRQSGYRAFVQNIERPELLPDGSRGHPRLGYRQTLALPGLPPIHIIGLDTAWLAGDDNDSTRLLLTEHQVVLNATNHDDGKPLPGLRLALMHHPLSDLGDAADARRLLSDHVDIVLHGHQHTAEAVDTANPDRGLRTLAAGSLYEGDEERQVGQQLPRPRRGDERRGPPAAVCRAVLRVGGGRVGTGTRTPRCTRTPPAGASSGRRPSAKSPSPRHRHRRADARRRAWPSLWAALSSSRTLAAALLAGVWPRPGRRRVQPAGHGGRGQEPARRALRPASRRIVSPAGYLKLTLGERRAAHRREPASSPSPSAWASSPPLATSLARVQMALEHQRPLLHLDNLDARDQARAAAELVERLPQHPA